MDIRSAFKSLIHPHLKGKIILSGITMIICTAVVFASYFIITEKIVFHNELKKRAVSLVTNLAYNCEYPVLLEDTAAISQLASGLLHDEDVSSVDIRNTAGKVLLHLEKNPVTNKDCSATHRPRKQSNWFEFFEHGGFLCISSPIAKSVSEGMMPLIESANSNSKTTIGWVTLGFSLKRTNDLIRSSIQNTLLITLIISTLSIISIFTFANRLIRPLRILANVTQEVASGNYAPRVDAARKDELGDLARSFNMMTETLESNAQILNSYHQRLEREIAERTADLIDRERSLKESEKKYRTIFENTGTAMLIIDENNILSLVNTECEKLTGCSKKELEGMKYFTDFIFEDDMKKVQEFRHLRLINSKDVPRSYEFRLKDRYGHIRDVFITAAILPETKTTVASVLDVTETKTLTAKLFRAQKMEAMGTLASGVAHDLNNVLGVLVGYSELLLLEIPEGSPSRTHVTKIMQSGTRAAAIIQDLLTLARRGVAVSQVMDLNAVIHEYLKTPEHEKLTSFHERVQVKTDFEEHLLNIVGSPVHLGKSIMNLVSNAAEAMPDGGIITISTCNRGLDIPVEGYETIPPGDYVALTVSDTGKGVSQEDIGRIFEPFYTKKVMGRSGTGLGLAVVWGTVKDHGGYIDIQSQEDKGATFILYFPVTRKELSRKEPDTVPLAKLMGKGEKILVVDDILEQRDLATIMLSNLGYMVTSVPSGEEAVEYLRANKTDLVLLDMIMDPGIDGLETYKRILEINPLQKAIILSGFSETDRVREAQQKGAGAYIKKPYVREKLGLAVRRELDQSTGR